MAGTFTRATFYKLDTSPNASVEYTGIYDATSPYSYRITNQASAGVIYAGGAALAMGASGSAIRIISPTGGTALSPTWPTTAGSPVTIWVQENIKGAGFLSPGTSSATVLAITNPAVSATQTFATTAAATISHSPALSTTGAGGTLQYNATTSATYSSTGWTSTTSPVILTRGTTYYLWARRGVGVSTNEGAFSVYNGPFTVPYLSPNLALGTISPNTSPLAPLELTGGNTSNVSVNWTTQANHTYQIIRNDLASPALVISETSTVPQSLLYSESSSPVGSPNSGLVDLPLEGKVANYTIQVKRSVASGGDGVWYDGTSINTPLYIQRIKEPTLDDTQDFNTSSPTPISHSITLKLNGLGGTLEYGWNTTGSPQQSAVTNWQSSNTFNNVFVRGNTYYFYARRSTDAADFDLSTAQVVPALATYGILINDTAGSPVFNTSTLPMNLITCKDGAGVEIDTATIASGATCSPIFVNGLTATNGSSVFVAVNGPAQISTVRNFTLNRGSGSFTITNNSAGSITVRFLAGRYK